MGGRVWDKLSYSRPGDALYRCSPVPVDSSRGAAECAAWVDVDTGAWRGEAPRLDPTGACVPDLLRSWEPSASGLRPRVAPGLSLVPCSPEPGVAVASAFGGAGGFHHRLAAGDSGCKVQPVAAPSCLAGRRATFFGVLVTEGASISPSAEPGSGTGYRTTGESPATSH
mmetsp:Transcript_621/g.1654  ORF Transcript_621/g.1654 Transcript_621/m.1654 type:complete len:169 (+) Transcript_621:127-633(+)